MLYLAHIFLYILFHVHLENCKRVVHKRALMMEQFKGKYKNAKVFFRIFPVERNDWTYVKICQDEKTIYCRCLQDFQAGYDCRVPKYWNFETDGVLCNKSQSDIYDNVMNGVIDG